MKSTYNMLPLFHVNSKSKLRLNSNLALDCVGTCTQQSAGTNTIQPPTPDDLLTVNAPYWHFNTCSGHARGVRTKKGESYHP